MKTEKRQKLQDQLEALEDAMASGVFKVSYEDTETVYRSLKEMEKAANTIQDALAPRKKRRQIKMTVAEFKSGY